MTILREPSGHAVEHAEAGHSRPRTNMLGYLRTTSHKDIAVLYTVTSFGFFVLAGILAMMMRAELARPGLQYFSNEQYNQLFTLHGTLMLLMFATPLAFAFANFLVPLQIGSPDVAFPRLNALSYWFFLFGGLMVVAGFLTPDGAADFGWFAYAPLNNKTFSPSVGADMWILGLVVSGLGTILGAVNMITTILTLRGPGMTMFRLPIFCWTFLVTSVLVIVAFPVLAGALLSLEADRRFGAHVFDSENGGAILWQHLFWFFGHPEVYIIALPFFGIISEIIPVFSRKPVFGYKGLVFATIAIGALSIVVWAHHMFVTGAVLLPFFAVMSFLIAVPTGIKFFNWIGTMWRGNLSFETPMMFCLGFLVTFLLGGLTGVMLASPPIDFHVSDSYFVVAHFHYVVFGTVVFAAFAGTYFWFPKLTGRMMDDRLGKIHFWTVFLGFHLTFLVQHYLGMQGMPRRYADYGPGDGFTTLNTVSTAGSFLLGVSTLPFMYNVWNSYRRGRLAVVDDPWGYGNSLEWATSSPPPRHNFHQLPRIRSERPAFDLHYPEVAGVTDYHATPELR
ncbi:MULTISPECIES: cytochrome c oxidase subunit I [unclassified Parafrankia]|uniref:aa3-type cytochrome oxidase subunit I n=1 Tax=unclassified Parafrankia TaxID=2994368 RepID=UPI000DA5AA19|nr:MULTISPECIES: cytochrome c oxidase subunit I [unclassified Parafrankia]TCJ40365.1 cytochrome c oxidase subunit I [Parafrankia sp. BMG5.11]SQD96113.1 putative cytochrome c oxidase subunit 1-alpha [Parafrankia sp. Ea1.12]